LNQAKLAEALEKLKVSPSSAECWEELHRLVWPLLIAKMHRRTSGNLYLAEEASQETMLRIVRYFDFAGHDVTLGQFLKYLYSTSNSVLIDMIRTNRRNHSMMTDAKESEHIADAQDPLPNPEERAIVQGLVEALFDKLNPREQQILGLLMQGKTGAEIASQMKIEDKTAENAISSLRAKCKKELFGR